MAGAESAEKKKATERMTPVASSECSRRSPCGATRRDHFFGAAAGFFFVVVVFVVVVLSVAGIDVVEPVADEPVVDGVVVVVLEFVVLLPMLEPVLGVEPVPIDEPVPDVPEPMPVVSVLGVVVVVVLVDDGVVVPAAFGSLMVPEVVELSGLFAGSLLPPHAAPPIASAVRRT